MLDPEAVDEVELHIADPLPEEHGPLFHFEPNGRSIEGGDVVQFTSISNQW